MKKLNLEISYKQCANLIVLLKEQNLDYASNVDHYSSSEFIDKKIADIYKKMLEENKYTIKQIEDFLFL